MLTISCHRAHVRVLPLPAFFRVVTGVGAAAFPLVCWALGWGAAACWKAGLLLNTFALGAVLIALFVPIRGRRIVPYTVFYVSLLLFPPALERASDPARPVD